MPGRAATQGRGRSPNEGSDVSVSSAGGGGGDASAVCTVSDPRGGRFKYLTVLLVNYTSVKWKK